MLAKLRLPASDRLAPVITAIIWLLVIGLIAWLAAHWYWRIAAPPIESPRHASPADATAAAADVASRHLFGVYVVASSAPAAQAATALAGRFKVLGVMANSRDTPGFAILQENDQPPITAIEGKEFQPGLRLLRVLPDGVEIGEGEVRERVAYTPATSTAAQNGVVPVAPAPVNAPPTTLGTGVAPPPPPQAPPGMMRRLNAPPPADPATPTEQPAVD